MPLEKGLGVNFSISEPAIKMQAGGNKAFISEVKLV